MSKLIIQIPAGLIEGLVNHPDSCWMDHLRKSAEDFIEGKADYLVMPSDGGWVVSIDGEGKMTEVEIKVYEGEEK